MSKKIESSQDLMNVAAEVLQGLRSGKVPVEMAQAQIRAINSINSTFALRLEHARLTGRLERNSDVLPGTNFDSKAKPAPKMPEARIAPVAKKSA